jgi:putative drug exporter of the RND superfamily
LFGSFVVRWPLIVIALWIALPAVLVLSFPSLSQRAAERPITILPDDAPSIATNQQMTEAFQAPATHAPETQPLTAQVPGTQAPQVPGTQAPAIQAPETQNAGTRNAGKQGAGTDNILLVVLTNEKGLGPADEGVYGSLVEKLRQDTEHVVMMQDFVSTPPVREVVTSKDHKAWYLPINLVGGLGSGEGYGAYKTVATTVKQIVAGSTLTAYLTGPAATVADITDASQRDVHLIEIATVVMVLSILLMIYRNVVTMLLPLITILISFVTAQGVVSALAPLGLGISGQTMILMTGIMIGAGTDYAVFLISRYHDFVRHGDDSNRAVKKALASVGKVIAASAATVAVTFLGMIFAQLNVFTTVGPAMAIAIAVAFLAAVTLLPAMLVLAGARGWVGPRRDLTSRQWRRSGIRIVRRPWTHLVASLLVLAILAGCAGLVRYNYDDRKTLPGSADSTLGYAAMDRHFPLNETIPQFLLVRSPHDLRTPRALADLEEMARRVSQMPGISMVRGITRPTGEPIDKAKVSHQAGEVGFKLGFAATSITDHTGDLDELAGGAHQLADSLGEVRGQVTEAVITVRPVVDALSFIAEQTGGEKTLKKIDNAANLIASMQELGKALSANLDIFADSLAWLTPALTALNASPICSVDASCRTTRRYLQIWVAAPGNGTFAKISDLARYLRSTRDAQTVDSTLTGLRQSLKGATDAALSLGLDEPGGLQSRLALLQSGAETLAGASQKLADGVQELVNANKRMGPGLSDASSFLLAMKRNASTPSMSGFYIPPEVLSQDDFSKAADIFVSPDGHAARFLVQTELNPFSTEAMDQINSITDTARGAQPNTALADGSISMTGFPATLRDTRDYYNHDVRLIMVTTIIVVLLILMTLLRAVVAPLYLIGSVLISYVSALGIGVILFQFILGQELHWSVPGLTFIVLVAVGADYNMLLISRIRDECGHGGGVRCGVIRTVGSTGGVITAAGLIFAASMFGLVLSSISTMVQAGFVLGIGLLIDTFLVRTITVPAIAALVGLANWWPSRDVGGQPATRTKGKPRAVKDWPRAQSQPEPAPAEPEETAASVEAIEPVEVETSPIPGSAPRTEPEP